MADAADDAFDAALRHDAINRQMANAGARRCPHCVVRRSADEACPMCDDLGWLDEKGSPCEP